MRQGTKQARVIGLLEAGFDPERPTRELAAAAGCSDRTALEALRRWLDGERVGDEVEQVRCKRCSFFGWDRNPVDRESELCLWCRLELAGVELAGFFRSGEAARVLGTAGG